MADIQNGNGAKHQAMLDSYLAKLFARLIFPAILTGISGFGAVVLKWDLDNSTAHTQQLNDVASEMKSIHQFVKLNSEQSKADIRRVETVEADHETRIRGLERR